MMNPVWLMRMTRWVHNPPSRKRVLFTLAIIGAAAAIWGLEALGLWPDWATAQRLPRGVRP